MDSDQAFIPGQSAIRGRGALDNPANRCDKIDYVADVDPEDLGYAAEPNRPRTEFYSDLSRSIIATNNSPDVGFDACINPYPG